MVVGGSGCGGGSRGNWWWPDEPKSIPKISRLKEKMYFVFFLTLKND